ncbi:collagen alpha-1(X) chain-like [Mytilus trossulus]|uniref:collagen alpha-1(X) chain-like n=1 Tax=Mytilus trossulus TaxID=6551 RepID=UPI0030056F44
MLLATFFLFVVSFSCSVVWCFNIKAELSNSPLYISAAVSKILEDNQLFESQLKVMANEMENYKSRIKVLESDLAFTKSELISTKQNAKDTNNRVIVLERELLLTKEMSKTSAEIPKFDKDDSVNQSHSSTIQISGQNRIDNGYAKDAVYQEFNLPDNSDTSKDIKRLLVGDNFPPVVAFSSTMDSHKENLGIGQTVLFEHVITNIGGGLDPNTSIFKAPITGVYHFDVVIMSHHGEDMETEIVKNGNGLVRLYSGNGDTWGVGMQSVVIQMIAGDDVWVRVYNNPSINDGNIRVFGSLWSSFSGFLVQ